MIKMIYRMPTVEIEELAVEQGFAATGVGVRIEVKNGADHEEGWA